MHYVIEGHVSDKTDVKDIHNQLLMFAVFGQVSVGDKMASLQITLFETS